MQIEWLTKEEAGVRLGSGEYPLSTRRVLELAREGKLKSQKVRDPNSGQMVTQIHAGSVEHFVDEREAGEVRESQTSHTRLTQRAIGDLLEALVREYANRTAARLWLTVAEAADYSGLPASILTELIRQGKLPALPVGIRRGGRWRIRRRDLDLFEGGADLPRPVLASPENHRRLSP